MPLRIIGSGFGRTGTLSLKLALEQLGFGPCHHMVEVFADEKRLQHWDRIARGEAADWEEVFEGFQSTVDWPSCNYWRPLFERFPEARIISSVRDPESWFRSTQATIFRDGLRSSPPSIRKIVSDAVGTDVHDRAACIAAFERHNAAVRAEVPPGKLLVFEAGQGWEPLCAFLGVPVPDAPYPRVNSTEDFQKLMAHRESDSTS